MVVSYLIAVFGTYTKFWNLLHLLTSKHYHEYMSARSEGENPTSFPHPF